MRGIHENVTCRIHSALSSHGVDAVRMTNRPILRQLTTAVRDGRAESTPHPAGDLVARTRRRLERRPIVPAAAAFSVTTAVGTVRYHDRHAADADHLVVVVLGALLAVTAAALTLTPARKPCPPPALAGLALGTVALVLFAPSTAWSVVPLVVLLQVTTPVVVATISGGAAVSAVVVSVPRLAGSRDDVGLVLGCALAGLVFLLAVALARSALDARARTVRELTAARALVSAAERRADRLEARRHLAAELHDTVVQSVAGALFLADAAERTGEGRHAEDARRALRVAVSDTRALVHELESGSGQEAAAGFEGELAEAAARVGATCEVIGEPRALPAASSLTVLRAAQGALGNAERHARATCIALELRYDEHGVVLRVSDDGVGFDPHAMRPGGPDGGHGLSIMRRRLAAVGGALTIRSDARGTVVEVVVPWVES